MQRVSVSSSNISSIGYDPGTGILEIEFKSGGIYQYSNVSTEVYQALLSAPSVGKFFYQNIKSSYEYSKIR